MFLQAFPSLFLDFITINIFFQYRFVTFSPSRLLYSFNPHKLRHLVNPPPVSGSLTFISLSSFFVHLSVYCFLIDFITCRFSLSGLAGPPQKPPSAPPSLVLFPLQRENSHVPFLSVIFFCPFHSFPISFLTHCSSSFPSASTFNSPLI